MAAFDFKKQERELYTASATSCKLLSLPRMSFLMIDGSGSPDSACFREAMEALYGAAYTLKFGSRKGPAPEGYFDYVVPPLEGLWWMREGKEFARDNKDDWCWRLMIRQPDFYGEQHAATAFAALRAKKNPPALDLLRLEQFEEGRAAQTLHIGPYDQEDVSIARLHAFVEEQDCNLRGKHHEIYLSDPRRTAAERLRTIIRMPVEAKGL